MPECAHDFHHSRAIWAVLLLESVLVSTMGREAVQAILKGLPELWDDDRCLRRRVGKGYCMMVSTTKGVRQVLGNLKNVSANADVLEPVVKLMAANGVVDTPPVEDLSDVCEAFLRLANYPDEANITTAAHQDAWGIKRCLTLCRRKWSKPETPKDWCNHKCMNVADCSFSSSHPPPSSAGSQSSCPGRPL